MFGLLAFFAGVSGRWRRPRPRRRRRRRQRSGFMPFSLFHDPKYSPWRSCASCSVLVVAVAGLLYA